VKSAQVSKRTTPSQPGRSLVTCSRELSVEQNHLRTAWGKKLVLVGKLLHEKGYVSGTDGNVSVRLNQDSILVTPADFCKGFMRPEDMVTVSLEGQKLFGRFEPTSEIRMHLTIYKMRRDVRAVVHAHPSIATALASAGLDLTRPICSELVMGLGTVPLAPYACPGTDELSAALNPFIADHDAILMQNHGVVTYASTLERAYLNMETVEHCSIIMLATTLLGRCRMLTDLEVRRLLRPRLRQPDPSARLFAFRHPSAKEGLRLA
jgi:L-fuculose-phosphate aldolase